MVQFGREVAVSSYTIVSYIISYSSEHTRWLQSLEWNNSDSFLRITRRKFTSLRHLVVIFALTVHYAQASQYQALYTKLGTSLVFALQFLLFLPYDSVYLSPADISRLARPRMDKPERPAGLAPLTAVFDDGSTATQLAN